MQSLGLAEAALRRGRDPLGLGQLAVRPRGLHGAADEVSHGKDTPSGHWEIAGQPVMFDWGYFPDDGAAFSDDLIAAIVSEGDVPGILGNCHASGTEIIASLGAEHMRTGKPICYTSSDSVFQIAAHEESFGLDRLITLCSDGAQTGRSAQYRAGDRPALYRNGQTGFDRTGNRRDFSVPPPGPTLLDQVSDKRQPGVRRRQDQRYLRPSGRHRCSQGQRQRGAVRSDPESCAGSQDGDLVFTNFVDFDMLYGHRRDVAGYAAALEALDAMLPRFAKLLKPGDLVLMTADHGCDPTWRGTDHTRERVPVLGFGPGIAARDIGIRKSFSDIGATLAAASGPARHWPMEGVSFDSRASRRRNCIATSRALLHRNWSRNKRKNTVWMSRTFIAGDALCLVRFHRISCCL
jgi:phosphopentomutase